MIKDRFFLVIIACAFLLFQGFTYQDSNPIEKNQTVENIIKNSDAVLYIGDGAFHPSALLFQAKQVITYNPISKSMKVLTQKQIEKNLKKIKANIKRFILANKIGIFVSTKPGQQNLRRALETRDLLQNKKSYLFIDNNIDVSEFENFGLDCWVNTACPKLDFDDSYIMNYKQLNLGN